MAETVKPKRRYDSSRRREQAATTRREILEAAQRPVRAPGLRGRRRWRRSRAKRAWLKTVYSGLRDQERRAARALELPAARRPGRRPGRPARVVPRGARGARSRAAAAPRRANARAVKERIGRMLRSSAPPPRSTPTSRRCGSGSRPSSTPTSARRRALGARTRCGPASTSTGPRTSSGPSTIPSCGSCSSSSGAGRRTSTSSGSPTPPSSSCWGSAPIARRPRDGSRAGMVSRPLARGGSA